MFGFLCVFRSPSFFLSFVNNTIKSHNGIKKTLWILKFQYQQHPQMQLPAQFTTTAMQVKCLILFRLNI